VRLSTLTDLQNRGVKDLLICSIDNLSGFGDAIETVFPQADVQLCLVHQVRTSLRYVVSKDQKAVVADLKPIYQSANLAGAEQKLADFADKWAGRPVPAKIPAGSRKLETELAALDPFL
jgi:putative transposase